MTDTDWLFIGAYLFIALICFCVYLVLRALMYGSDSDEQTERVINFEQKDRDNDIHC
jgi:hypothetical protein